jgi:hypothetical protein
VIVDNQIPTYELVDGSPRPFFARCGNPLLFWVCLIEKAYAKLHGRYYALHGGSTDEALEDMMGAIVENCFIDDGSTMTDKTSLFNTLRTLTFNHTVVGCKLDLEMFTWMDPIAKKKHYAKAIALGIQPFHMYSILDTRIVKGINQTGAKEDFNIVRLACPWADAVEWSGRCSDMNDHFWTPEVKASFND